MFLNRHRGKKKIALVLLRRTIINDARENAFECRRRCVNAPCFVRKFSSASDGSARAAVAAADAQTTTTMTLGRRSKTNANKRAEEASSSLSIATRLHEEEEEEDHREPSSSSSSSFLKENKEILSVCGLTFVCAPRTWDFSADDSDICAKRARIIGCSNRIGVIFVCGCEIVREYCGRIFCR